VLYFLLKVLIVIIFQAKRSESMKKKHQTEKNFSITIISTFNAITLFRITKFFLFFFLKRLSFTLLNFNSLFFFLDYFSLQISIMFAAHI
jgi:hypothetical protein